MKEPWLWEEDDLEALVHDGTQENISLDYKRCDALAKTEGKKTEISKDVSAFANSAGGVIVYGIIEDRHVPTAIDAGFDPNEISKEWLDQVINSRIQRRIDGVRVKQVALARTNPGRVVYVVWVPQSVRAPHQASDKKFYKRFNFESVPMEEYEIRDVARRAEVPDIDVTFAFNADGATEQRGIFYQEHASGPRSTIVFIFPNITNHASAPANHAVVELLVDKQLFLGPVQAQPILTKQLKIGDSEHRRVHVLRINWSTHGKMPLFQGVSFAVTDSPFEVSFPEIQGKGRSFFLGANLYAPGMAPRQCRCWLKFYGDEAIIDPWESRVVDLVGSAFGQ